MEENEGVNRLTQVHLEKWPLKRIVCVVNHWFIPAVSATNILTCAVQ